MLCCLLYGPWQGCQWREKQETGLPPNDTLLWCESFFFFKSLNMQRLRGKALSREIQTVSDLWWFYLWFFFLLSEGAKTIGIQQKPRLESWIWMFSQASDKQCDTLVTLGCNSDSSPSSQSAGRSGTIVSSPYTDSHPVPRKPFCFSLSIPSSINYMRYSALSYKIGFGDDFTQQ